MTLDDFVQLHNGKYLDFDGYYGAQCVDLIEYYLREVLVIPTIYGNAIDWFGKDNVHLDWISNTPTNFPLKGDIVVWHQDYHVGTGVYGHISVNLTANTNSFISFDQNWPPGSPCHKVTHNYYGVTGWGRRKVIVPPIPIPVGDEKLTFGFKQGIAWILYRTALLRDPESQTAIDSWANQIKDDGSNLQQVAQDMRNHPEGTPWGNPANRIKKIEQELKKAGADLSE